MRNVARTGLIIALLALSAAAQAQTWAGTRSYPSNQTRPWSWNGSMATLLAWTPASDPDRDYNRGRVPLHPRFADSSYFLNANARNEGSVATVGPWYVSENSASYVSCGADYFDMYTYSFWQYVDIFICFNNWHQSMSAELFDIAHRNGVRVYNLIMNPSASDMGLLLQQDSSGHFPGADQLIAMAQYYGFDGWFFNLETAGNATLAAKLRDFFIYFNQVGTPLGVHAMMYDSWIENGAVSYQNALNANNDWYFHYNGSPAAHEFFMNYWFTVAKINSSRTTAISYGRSPYDVFAGFEVWQHYWQTGGVLQYPVTSVFPAGQPHKLSLACFQMNGSRDMATDNLDYYHLEEQFFCGYNHDPANTATGNDWQGCAHYYPGKSVIDSLPFFTNFNTGHGHLYAIDGTISRTRDWYNRAVQDILPTWRWRMESAGTKLAAQFDWSDAYEGGSCLGVSGDLSSDNLLKLYMTHLAVTANTKLDIAFKTGVAAAPSWMQVALSFTDAPSVWVGLNVDSTASADWNLKMIDLSSFAGRTIGGIGLKFLAGGGSGYQIKVGRIGLYDGSIEIPSAPSNLVVADKAEDRLDTASLRLSWTAAPGDIWYYNIYRRRPDSTLEYLSGTTITAHCVPSVCRIGSEDSTIVEVEAVSRSFGRSARAIAHFHWVGSIAPTVATQPSPADGAVNVNPALTACWHAGTYASSRDVYFGTDNPPPLSGNQGGDTLALALAPGTTYYWRVDERNGNGATSGPVWSFTTAGPQMKRTERAPEAGGVVAARGENLPNEGKLKAFDNDTTTKWLDFSGTTWISYHFGSGHQYAITEYAITSDNDSPDRDPKNWTLSGSNDGSTWTPLDARSDIVFSRRYQPRSFFIVNPTPYAYYRLDIACNAGSTTQLAEVDFAEYVDTTAGVGGQRGAKPLPAVLGLDRGRPNPFAGSTRIEYQLPAAGRVSLKVYDVTGRLVRTLTDGFRAAGYYVASWDGRDSAGNRAAAGVYLCRLATAGGTRIRRLVMVR
ncbi:MAG TPA: FlgD immunoglobulin-like domain containing protein [Candidatus Edwardsbacteria bacterium]|nr:FlgD immunoglobulin-like domain containing protein [Candidatus Edwardsbacteria bacterium]